MVKKYNDFDPQLESVVALTDKAKLSLYKKSTNSGIPIGILEEIYSRGYNSWNPDLGYTPEQFGFDRVNSFIAGGFAVQLDEDLLDEKRGLWDNIHAKRKRIKAGSGERMRRPGEKGAPTDAAIRASQNEDADPCWKGYKQIGMKTKNGKKVPNCVPVKEQLDRPLPSVLEIAKKFDTSVGAIKKAIKHGSTVEKEHTKEQKTAEKIATAHVNERPDYYKKLNKAGLEENAEKHSKNPKDPSSRFIGSNELTDIYKNQTPGQIIRRVVKEHIEEAAMYMPPNIEQPRIERPAPQRQFSRSVTTSGRMGSGAGAMRGGVQVQRAAPARAISSRMSGQGGSMTGQVQTQRAAAPRAPTSSMPAGQGGAMTAKPTVTKGVEATKFTVQKGMSAAGREAATKAAEKAIPAVAGRAAGALGGVAGAAITTAAPELGKAMAASYKAGHQSFKSHSDTGEKASDVFARMKQPSQGRSIGQYEKDVLTPKKTETPKAPDYPKADVPTPPSRPEYFSRGQAFSAAREKAGGGTGQFTYDNKPFQTNIKSEPYVPAAKQKPTGIEAESGGKTLKKIKEAISEATYQGKKVPLNKPMKGDVKKSKVYVDPDGDGIAKKVNFGDKNLSIKKNIPARKKSYCARSAGQGNLTDKTSANYWSRKAWNCEETQVDETWARSDVDRQFTMGKTFNPLSDEEKARAEKVISGMKVPSPKGETPEARQARIARNTARQRAAVGMKEEHISELSVPAGTTGKREKVSTPMVAVRMASGKIEKHPPGKSGSSGGGDE